MDRNAREVERRVRQAEDDALEARDAYDRLLAQNRQDREDRQRQDREAREESMRSARNWPDAFNKNLYLMGRERNQCQWSEKDPEDYQRDVREMRAWWEREIDQIKKAQELWQAGWPAVEEAMAALRANVADALQADQVEHGDQRGGDLIKALREDTIDDWLNW